MNLELFFIIIFFCSSFIYLQIFILSKIDFNNILYFSIFRATDKSRFDKNFQATLTTIFFPSVVFIEKSTTVSRNLISYLLKATKDVCKYAEDPENILKMPYFGIKWND